MLLALLLLLLPVVASALTSALRVYEDVFAYPQYGVRYDAPLSEDDAAALPLVERLCGADGLSYACVMPKVSLTERESEQFSISSAPLSAAEATAKKSKLENTIKEALVALSPLQSSCLLLKRNHWAYEFCYQKHVLQRFNTQDASQNMAYMLGKYSSAQKVSVHMGSDRNYLVQRYVQGTLCDVTKMPRTVEVQFYCNVNAAEHIAMVKELSICSYEITVSTPRLCYDSTFSVSTEVKQHWINCHPVLNASSLQAYRTGVKLPLYPPSHPLTTHVPVISDTVPEKKAQVISEMDMATQVLKKLGLHNLDVTALLGNLEEKASNSKQKKEDNHNTFIIISEAGDNSFKKAQSPPSKENKPVVDSTANDKSQKVKADTIVDKSQSQNVLTSKTDTAKDEKDKKPVKEL